MPELVYNQAYNDYWLETKSVWDANIAMAVPTSCPLMEKMFMAGNIVKGNDPVGGKRMVKLIQARINKNSHFADLDDVIPSETVNLMEACEFDLKLLPGSYTLNRIRVASNKKEQIADLVKTNEIGLRDGTAWRFSHAIYRHGLGPTEFGGLKYLISDNPYAANLVVLNLLRGGNGGPGEVGDSQEFWRNRVGALTQEEFKNLSPTDKAEKLVEIIDFVMTHMSQNKLYKIDGIYMHEQLYMLVKNYLRAKLTVQNVPEQKTDVGFDHIYYNHIQIFPDLFCPRNHVYFIRSKSLKLAYMPGFDFERTVEHVPSTYKDQYISTFYGNFVIETPRANAVVWFANSDDEDSIVKGIPDKANMCKPDDYDDPDYVDDTPDGSGGDKGTEYEPFSGSGVPIKQVIPPANKGDLADKAIIEKTMNRIKEEAERRKVEGPNKK